MKTPTPIAGGFVVALLVGMALSVSGCNCCPSGSCGGKCKPAASAKSCPDGCTKPCCTGDEAAAKTCPEGCTKPCCAPKAP